MKLSDLPDIEFVSAEEQEILSYIINLYSEITGRTLAQGDPVRLFLCAIASIVIMLCNKINYTGKQNLLKYATGDNLDHIGVLVGTDRLGQNAAMTTLKVTLSDARAVPTLISAGVRATAGDNVFFTVDKNYSIPAGAREVEVSATCTVAGATGNGYLPGEINKLVDPIPFVASVVNVTLSEGGADTEDDEAYREAIREAPERFSSAGPDGAYIYFAKRASALIVDVNVTSPSPGEVLITPLLENGILPEQKILDKVSAVCNDRRVRPLTDQVSVAAPEVVSFDVKASYYIDRINESSAVTIQTQIAAAVEAYVLWQKSKLGRDINPSELHARIMMAGAKRVEIAEPVFRTIASNQVAIANTVSITLGGMESE